MPRFLQLIGFVLLVIATALAPIWHPTEHFRFFGPLLVWAAFLAARHKQHGTVMGLALFTLAIPLTMPVVFWSILEELWLVVLLNVAGILTIAWGVWKTT
jgi:hypothetical protein